MDWAMFSGMESGSSLGASDKAKSTSSCSSMPATSSSGFSWPKKAMKVERPDFVIGPHLMSWFVDPPVEYQAWYACFPTLGS